MRKVFSLLMICLLSVSCDDIFEQDIAEDIMTVISPKENKVIVGNSVFFSWNTLEGASDYRLQILRDNTEEILIDSIVSSDILGLPLNSGLYGWRVRGENSAYQSFYSDVESFSVESTNDLSGQNVFLTTPSDNFYTRNNTVILNWQLIDAATSYSLQVEKTKSGNVSLVLQDTIINSSTYTLSEITLDEDAIYKWGIQAMNEGGKTSRSNRRLYLDTNLPTLPTLVSPNDNATESTIVIFSWNQGQDSGEVQSPVENILEISLDEGFQNLIRTYVTDLNTQDHTFDTVDEYFWRVSTKDAAGNESTATTFRNLTIE